MKTSRQLIFPRSECITSQLKLLPCPCSCRRKQKILDGILILMEKPPINKQILTNTYKAITVRQKVINSFPSIIKASFHFLKHHRKIHLQTVNPTCGRRHNMSSISSLAKCKCCMNNVSPLCPKGFKHNFILQDSKQIGFL